MKKMNKKGFTLVELLAVIVILAILMAIAATNLGPVIDNSRRASMRSTAQQIMSSVQSQLTSSFELYPGYYQWSVGILDSGGINAPFGGDYRYHGVAEDETTDEKKIGSGVFKMKGEAPTCNASATSYIIIDRTEDGRYDYTICLTTTQNSYLYGNRTDVDKKVNTIFYGDAGEGVNANANNGTQQTQGTGN